MGAPGAIALLLNGWLATWEDNQPSGFKNPRITQSRFAETFPRLFELKDAVPDPTHRGAAFQTLDRRLEDPLARVFYEKLERTLGLLDAEAWSDLKRRATSDLIARDPLRGWQALFAITGSDCVFKLVAREQVHRTFWNRYLVFEVRSDQPQRGCP